LSAQSLFVFGQELVKAQNVLCKADKSFIFLLVREKGGPIDVSFVCVCPRYELEYLHQFGLGCWWVRAALILILFLFLRESMFHPLPFGMDVKIIPVGGIVGAVENFLSCPKPNCIRLTG
jgi:hypothetical protein